MKYEDLVDEWNSKQTPRFKELNDQLSALIHVRDTLIKKREHLIKAPDTVGYDVYTDGAGFRHFTTQGATYSEAEFSQMFHILTADRAILTKFASKDFLNKVNAISARIRDVTEQIQLLRGDMQIAMNNKEAVNSRNSNETK